MQEMRVQSLGREDPQEGEMEAHSSILAWIIPQIKKSDRLQSRRLQRVEHNWVTEHAHAFLLIKYVQQASVYSGVRQSVIFLFFFFSFIFISWRPITLQYCSGFCHTLTWIIHGFTCIPHPDAPSSLPLYLIALGLPSAPGPSTCLIHPTWAGDLFHYR